MKRLCESVLGVLVATTVFCALGYGTIPVIAGRIVCQAISSVLLSVFQTGGTDSPVWLKMVKDATASAQSVATIVALIIGAWWVFKRRRIYPRAKFTHTISDVKVEGDQTLLHVAIVVENVGDVLLPLGPSVVCAQQLNPLPDSHHQRVATGGKLLPDGALEVDWPILDRCDQDWKGNELEPGESGAFHFDLLVSQEIKTVLVYSYFTNLAKPDREIGWNTSTVYQIEASSETIKA